MARTTGIISVDPQGRSVVVDITGPAGAGTFYTTDSGATAHTLPLTITDITEFHVTTPADYAVSAKIGDHECLPGGRGISNVGRGCRSAYVVGMSGSDAGEEAGGSAASSPFTALTIPTVLTGWQVADATGTWVDNGDGTISQTTLTIGDFSIFNDADIFASGFIAETRIRVDAEAPGSGAEIGFLADYPAIADSELTGTGMYLALATATLDGTITMYGYGAPAAPQAGPAAWAVTSALGDWHTYRWSLVGGRGALYVDGVLVGLWLPTVSSASSVVPGASSRFALYCSGGATFDLTATKFAYEPLPTFPA